MKILFCVTLLAIAVFSGTFAATSRCAPRCRANKTALPACGKVLSMGLTDSEITILLDKHNEMRTFVADGLETQGNPGPQPPAENMQKLTWDNALASMAQGWANTCKYKHDPCRKDARFYVGQNIGETMTTGTVKTVPTDIVQLWYDEVDQLNRTQVSSLTNSTDVGHYTQIVWANTNKLGCGKIVYVPSDTWKHYYLVCNYGPGGNIIRKPIYETAQEIPV